MMLTKTARMLQRNGFWIVLICHCLLFLGLSLQWTASVKLLKTQPEDRPSLFIPSYIAHNLSAPTQQQSTPSPPTPAPKKSPETPDLKKSIPISKNGIEKPIMTNARPTFNTSHPIDISRAPDTEPVHLIGDKKIDRPLLTLLGKALTKHLIYPKSAIDLNVKGTSVIGFVLYPDGHITNVQLLRTSTAQVLDQAALAAANGINPVANVTQYLTQPKFMVIGIIFE